MKKLLASLLLATTAGSAVAATYDIDPFHANARFAIDHFNTSTNVGAFYGLTGTVGFDEQKR